MKETLRFVAGVHVEDGVSPLAVSHQGADINAAVPTNQEIGGLEPKAIAPEACRVGHLEAHMAVRVGGCQGGVLPAEATAAGPDRQFLRRAARGQPESHLAAMTFAENSRFIIVT